MVDHVAWNLESAQWDGWMPVVAIGDARWAEVGRDYAQAGTIYGWCAQCEEAGHRCPAHSWATP